MTMTDNEIIKALECCKVQEGCESCPMYDGTDDCCPLNNQMIIDLINRQKKEIEILQNRTGFELYLKQKSELEKKDIEIAILIRKKEALNDEISELKAEVERLREFGNKLRKAYTMAYSNGFGLCKSIFFKKLEKALADNIDISHAQYESIMFDVHNIVDELKIEKLTE